jgi:protein-disulfide isomerase
MNRFSKPLVPGAVILLLALGAWLPSACSAQDKGAKPAAGGDQVLAIVNGKPISDSEVRKKAADQFAQLEREYESNKRQVLENQLEQAIREHLLEAEAAAKGVPKEQLLADIKAPDITDADIDKFYEERKAQIPQPKEQVAGQIKQYLQQQQQQVLAELRQKYFEGLEAKYKVDRKLEPQRVEVSAIGPTTGGPATAPVTIVEFSDFQCPYCSKLTPTLDQVKKKYGDKVRIVFRQFPLPMHQNAQKAAEAALCANDQGKFWQLHDAMFSNQAALGVEQLKAKAVELGLKADDFNKCLDSGAKVSVIEADKKAGSEAGVNGTPAMFINGRFLNGAQPLENVTKVIDDELRRKGGA